VLFFGCAEYAIHSLFDIIWTFFVFRVYSYTIQSGRQAGFGWDHPSFVYIKRPKGGGNKRSLPYWRRRVHV